MNQIHVELVEHSPGSPHSGIGRYTRELQSHLSGYVTTTLTTHREPPLSDFVTTFHHFPIGVTDHRPGSIVHFVEDLGCSQMLWRPLRPAVATSHDLGVIAWPPERKMHPTIDRIVWRLSYIGLKKMDAVIAVSNFSRQILIRRLHLDPRRVFTVHSGINTSTFRPISGARQELIARYRLPAAEELRYLTYVGTEIPRKNMRTILKTLSRLPPNVMLLKVGSPGNWRARQATYDEIRRLGLGGRVLFYEDVPDDDLPLFYSAADAYIACSFLEGFCMPILEAMACGTPVVCSNVAALPEVAGDAAILIPPTDDRRFAEAVASILSDSRLRKRMASKGLERTRTFSWQKTAEGVMAVYERVAQQHRESG